MPLESNMTSGTNTDEALSGVSGEVKSTELWVQTALAKHMDPRRLGATPEQALAATNEWNSRTDKFVSSKAQFVEDLDDAVQAVRTGLLPGLVGHGDYRRTQVQPKDFAVWWHATADSRSQRKSEAHFRFLTEWLTLPRWIRDSNPLLHVLEILQEELYCKYDPEDPDTAPGQKHVDEFLQARGIHVSKRIRHAFFTILNPPEAPVGRPSNRRLQLWSVLYPSALSIERAQSFQDDAVHSS